MKAAMHLVYALALLSIAVVPASADLYSDGPINGIIGAYTICCSWAVSDSFVLSSAAIVSGVDFGAWTFAGDSVTSVQWSIGTMPGDSSSGSGVATTTDTFFSGNSGYTIDSDSFSTGNISLGAGTYYLTLQNATTAQGSIAFWDQDNGPSYAFQTNGPCAPAAYCGVANEYGSGTNSESFGIQGTSGAVTPEPGYWALLSVTIVGIVWVKRRRARVQA